MLLALLFIAAPAQHLSALPPDLAKVFKRPGDVVDVIRFQESAGKTTVDNVVFVVVETAKNGVGIYGYHFVFDEKREWRQVWKTQDGVFDCELDQVARYLPSTLDATDLDNNGRFETFFAYETACHGDVSPTSIKLLMHEGEKKYALRGRSKVVVDDKGKTEGGDATPDEAFKSAPAAFLKEAKKRFASALVTATVQ
jgi:hypothetical protein